MLGRSSPRTTAPCTASAASAGRTRNPRSGLPTVAALRDQAQNAGRHRREGDQRPGVDVAEGVRAEPPTISSSRQRPARRPAEDLVQDPGQRARDRPAGPPPTIRQRQTRTAIGPSIQGEDSWACRAASLRGEPEQHDARRGGRRRSRPGRRPGPAGRRPAGPPGCGRRWSRARTSSGSGTSAIR